MRYGASAFTHQSTVMQRKYPWEEWFKEKITVIVRGEDYDCSQSSMVQSIRNRATLDGLKVKVIDTDTEIIIVVMGRREDEVPCTATAPITGQLAQPNLAKT